MEKKYLELNNVSSYKMAFGLSNYTWAVVVRWDYFAKDTVGNHLFAPLIQFQRISPRDLEDTLKKIR